MFTGKTRRPLAVFSVLAVGVIVAACGSSNSTSSNTAGSSGISASATQGVAQAREAVAPYIGRASPFPTSTALTKVPKGSTIAYMDCGTPICALYYELLQPAAKTMGVKLVRIQAGTAASTVSSAFNAVVAQKPAAVIVVAIDIQLWANQLKQLQKSHIPVITQGVIGTGRYGIEAPQVAEAEVERDGPLIADYIISHFGPKSNVVFYGVPELSYSPFLQSAFVKEMHARCPGCSVRTVPISVTTIGSGAPATVVSDLQAHPSTNVAVFATDEIEYGLPAATQQAGITVKTFGYGAGPTNLEYLKEGKETAVLAGAEAVDSWSLLDQAAREIDGEKLTGEEAKGLSVITILTQSGVTFDPSQGWPGYPNYAQRFSTLWGVSQ